MKFSEKLQKLRKENNYSQEQLADMLDVSRQSVSKWESGQTYPEMDKLLSMCKIFKCSLDDLTNDEITDFNISKKQKNNFTNIIDELLDIINRSLNMFKKMNKKNILHLIFEMFILVILLCLFKIPFTRLYDLISNIFSNFPIILSNILSSIFNLIITVLYFILCIIIFVYIYKVRYLDKYDNIEEIQNLNTNSRQNEKNIDNKIKYKNNNEFKIFKILGNIVMIFIKFFAFFISIPFLFSSIFLFAALIISIILIFKKVIFIGIIIGIISSILLNILILELIFNFIFNKVINAKRTFLILIISLSGIGIASGITVLDITNIDYIDSVNSNIKPYTLTREFNMEDNLIINNHYDNIEYLEDNNMQDNIIISVEYYKDYSKYNIEKNDNFIYIGNNYTKSLFGKDFFNMMIDDLSNKKIYNYNKLLYSKITIRTSKENIIKMQDNLNKYYEEIQNREDEYNNEISEYENVINNQEEKIYNLEDENNKLEEKVKEYENKIQEYKDKINSLINIE